MSFETEKKAQTNTGEEEKQLNLMANLKDLWFNWIMTL